METIEYKKIPLIKQFSEETAVNLASIEDECEALASLLISKNSDYGNSFEEQFNEYGLTSVIIRLEDKLRRLKSLHKNEQLVTDESLVDTLTDLAGYGVLGSICLMKKGENNG